VASATTAVFVLGACAARIKGKIVSGRITALKVQKRNRQRVNVYIDGQFAFGLAAIQAMQLSIGQELSAAEIDQLKEKDQVEAAYELALNFLSYRPRSTVEVQRRLAEKGWDEHTVEEVVTRLSRSGLLDDESFVRYWVENRDTHRPRGCRALRYELLQKGVANRLIDAELADYDEGDAAYRAASAQATKLVRQSEDTDIVREKLLAFLHRRGFSFDTARDALDRVFSELRPEEAGTNWGKRD
jgi:regulatory protein